MPAVEVRGVVEEVLKGDLNTGGGECNGISHHQGMDHENRKDIDGSLVLIMEKDAVGDNYEQTECSGFVAVERETSGVELKFENGEKDDCLVEGNINIGSSLNNECLRQKEANKGELGGYEGNEKQNGTVAVVDSDPESEAEADELKEGLIVEEEIPKSQFSVLEATECEGKLAKLDVVKSGDYSKNNSDNVYLEEIHESKITSVSAEFLQHEVDTAEEHDQENYLDLTGIKEEGVQESEVSTTFGLEFGAEADNEDLEENQEAQITVDQQEDSHEIEIPECGPEAEELKEGLIAEEEIPKSQVSVQEVTECEGKLAEPDVGKCGDFSKNISDAYVDEIHESKITSASADFQQHEVDTGVEHDQEINLDSTGTKEVLVQESEVSTTSGSELGAEADNEDLEENQESQITVKVFTEAEPIDTEETNLNSTAQVDQQEEIHELEIPEGGAEAEELKEGLIAEEELPKSQVSGQEATECEGKLAEPDDGKSDDYIKNISDNVYLEEIRESKITIVSAEFQQHEVDTGEEHDQEINFDLTGTKEVLVQESEVPTISGSELGAEADNVNLEENQEAQSTVKICAEAESIDYEKTILNSTEQVIQQEDSDELEITVQDGMVDRQSDAEEIKLFKTAHLEEIQESQFPQLVGVQEVYEKTDVMVQVEDNDDSKRAFVVGEEGKSDYLSREYDQDSDIVSEDDVQIEGVHNDDASRYGVPLEESMGNLGMNLKQNPELVTELVNDMVSIENGDLLPPGEIQDGYVGDSTKSESALPVQDDKLSKPNVSVCKASKIFIGAFVLDVSPKTEPKKLGVKISREFSSVDEPVIVEHYTDAVVSDTKSISSVRISKLENNCSDQVISDVCFSPKERSSPNDTESISVLPVENGGYNLVGQEKEGTNLVRKDEMLTYTENSTIAALEGKNAGGELEKRPIPLLIKYPYDYAENLKELIKHAQLILKENTEKRDAIRAELHKESAICKEYYSDIEAAWSNERAANDMLRSKRQEIDASQSLINRVKDAMDVEEIDSRLRNLQHRIEHETVPLKEEKQLIREIKQLKQQREQISSNMDELRQVLDQKDETEDRLKYLKKELDLLRDDHAKADSVIKAARKNQSDNLEKYKKLKDEFTAADEIQRKSYTHFQSLKKQLNEKTKYYWKYKDDRKLACEYLLKGDKEAVQQHCDNQVEEFMDLWNKNDEFRKEYVQLNTRSTLRRLRTLDGRSLGPNEEPPVIPNATTSARVVKENAVLVTSPEQEKQVLPNKAGKPLESAVKRVELKNQIANTKNPAKASTLNNGSATVSGRDEVEDVKVEEDKLTEEEVEMARKTQELRKKEEAEKLKERCRSEQKAKSEEARERKKRTAEKAQARAALRAQKEAEEKEKGREKRAKKKERKKTTSGAATHSIKGTESTSSSETPENLEVTETRDKPLTATKRVQKPYQFTKKTKAKSIPLPLRNRGNRRMHQWMWYLLAVLLAGLLFLVWKFGF